MLEAYITIAAFNDELNKLAQTGYELPRLSKKENIRLGLHAGIGGIEGLLAADLFRRALAGRKASIPQKVFDFLREGAIVRTTRKRPLPLRSLPLRSLGLAGLGSLVGLASASHFAPVARYLLNKPVTNKKRKK